MYISIYKHVPILDTYTYIHSYINTFIHTDIYIYNISISL